ncbi:MAG: hypothetical protein F4X03_00100 [Dehalococcoidia bacterium]|nr:hypothetical protein [Dehalococcoidia bacterium]MYD27313.1 hypothetical protein [Dehalococcoidia bacterium]
MGIEALTHDDDGKLVVPETAEEWDEWVSASRTRNHVLDNPLVDWLERWGEEHGYEPDPVEEDTDFLTFLFGKGNAFEAAVVEHLRGLAEVRMVEPEGMDREELRQLSVAEATYAAMADGAEIICQAWMRDPQSRTYGAPDLLVRSDVLADLFPGSISDEAAAMRAPDLGIGDRHYRVVDIKFSTLHLAAGGELGNSGSAPAYKAQVYIYNRALGRLQGYLPPEAFVLGRGWEQTRRGEKSRGTSCMERLAPVANDYASRKGGALSHQVEEAVAWVRRVRAEGRDWHVLPEPSVDELRPSAKEDVGRWASVVKEIVKQSEDLTQLWWVGVPRRQDANRQGLMRWTDPRVTPETLGVTGTSRAPNLRALLDVNREPGPDVRPAHISEARADWIEEAPAEFYVDFETVSDLDDDFSGIPERGGQPLIFMVGCGHLEDGDWRFKCFIADLLDERSEAKVIDDWFEHMTSVRDRLAPGVDPKVIHWSPHETITLETAFDAAVKRHEKTGWQHTRQQKPWPHPNWFDYLNKVMKREPVVVRGAHGFGLKAVTNAMHDLGLVETRWDEGPADGLGAMVGAWTCDGEARRTGGSMRDLELMKGIGRYNEVDCKAMMELVRYLRRHH